MKDHFAQKSHTKDAKPNMKRNNSNGEDQTEAKRFKQEKEKENVQFVRREQDSDEDEDVFCVTAEEDNVKINCKIGGVRISATIDSGCKSNLINEETWKYLKSHLILVTDKQKCSDKGFKSYSGHQLICMGMFTVQLDKYTSARFYVMEGNGESLIGRRTAKQMGILKINGVIVDIPVRDDVKPVIQPYRRIPVPLEKVVDEKIGNLLDQGIIEKVHGPPNWVSPLVVVPRNHSDDIRICVDMRRANQAADRENHPLPTFEDFLPRLGNAEYFSKIYIKNAFHQV